VELEYHHPLATGAVTDDNIAQQTYLSTKVEETQTMLHGIVAHLVADLVVQIVHQPTFLDGENLVESTSDVESDSRNVFQTRTFVIG
jgi:hypothetical protein